MRERESERARERERERERDRKRERKMKRLREREIEREYERNFLKIRSIFISILQTIFDYLRTYDVLIFYAFLQPTRANINEPFTPPLGRASQKKKRKVSNVLKFWIKCSVNAFLILLTLK